MDVANSVSCVLVLQGGRNRASRSNLRLSRNVQEPMRIMSEMPPCTIPDNFMMLQSVPGFCFSIVIFLFCYGHNLYSTSELGRKLVYNIQRNATHNSLRLPRLLELII